MFYTQSVHEKFEYVRFLTGRRQEINIWEIFVWVKKNSEDVREELRKVEEVLQDEVTKNKVSETTHDQAKGTAVYETDAALEEYLEFHYGQNEHFGIKNFPNTCAHKVIAAAKTENIVGRALDMGCAVGRATIELAAHFNEVVGLDISHKFVETANKILQQKHKELTQRVKFVQGDACQLNAELGTFDTVFAGNLLDRVANPEQFLREVAKMLKPKSLLVLASPYTWL